MLLELDGLCIFVYRFLEPFLRIKCVPFPFQGIDRLGSGICQLVINHCYTWEYMLVYLPVILTECSSLSRVTTSDRDRSVGSYRAVSNSAPGASLPVCTPTKLRRRERMGTSLHKWAPTNFVYFRLQWSFCLSEYPTLQITIHGIMIRVQLPFPARDVQPHSELSWV